MPSISLQKVSFSYPVFGMVGRSLKVSVMRQAVGASLSTDPGVVYVNALQNISLELNSGDRLGLIGHNGSGKSSLLRLLAGLAHADAGDVDIDGRVVPLIERGLGINPELTGHANIELPLRLLGATNDEINAAKEDIPEWTGLGPYMNMPVRIYSDGMKARLMFALSTAIEADILLLDEWIGAGDAAFIDQAQDRLTDYLTRTAIVVLATHSLEILTRVCTKVAWLEKGRLVGVGEPQAMVDAYLNATSPPRESEPVW
jgi:lipopolysaccharide transport system ATP-binding protein